MSFFDEFNHIVPYFVKINVGGNRPFRTDKTKKNNSNHKGKLFAYYKKAETLKELAKYGLGEHTEYLPAEQLSLPINIQVDSEENLTTDYEEFSKYTNKENTHHSIRIFNENKIKVGYVSISLTPSGDIYHKSYFYDSPDGTESIMHSTFNNMRNGELVKDECFKFKKNSKSETKKIIIHQRNGKVIGCSVTEMDLETKEDVLSSPITEFGEAENNSKLKKYIASCVTEDEIDYNERGGLLIPYECMILENDLFEYTKTMNKFEKYAKRFEEKTGIKLSLEKAIEIGNLSYREQTELGFLPNQFNNYEYSKIATYLANEKNNRLREFKGSYIGNILKLTNKGYEACIVTKHKKNEQNFKLYTLIDLKGISITQGSGPEEYLDLYTERDANYFEKFESADKTPTFVTKVRKDGKEELALYRGKPISGDCPEYKQFVEDFIAPLSEIKPVKISQILNKENTR